jgi:hypothetical protein
LVEYRTIPVPADASADVVPDHQRLFECLGAHAGEVRGTGAKRQQQSRNRRRHLHSAFIEIVAPPEGDRLPFSLPALKGEGLERQGFAILEQCPFFRHRDEVLAGGETRRPVVEQ